MAREPTIRLDIEPLRDALDALEARVRSRVDALEDRVDALPLAIAEARAAPAAPWRVALGALVVGLAFGGGLSIGLVPIALLHAYSAAAFLLAW